MDKRLLNEEELNSIIPNKENNSEFLPILANESLLNKNIEISEPIITNRFRLNERLSKNREMITDRLPNKDSLKMWLIQLGLLPKDREPFEANDPTELPPAIFFDERGLGVLGSFRARALYQIFILDPKDFTDEEAYQAVKEQMLYWLMRFSYAIRSEFRTLQDLD